MDKLIKKHGDEVEINKAIVYGKRAGEIVKFAQLNMVDLIVMSSHRLDLSDKEPNFGTISYKVGLMSSCPILLVK
jgi:universal stress protein A